MDDRVCERLRDCTASNSPYIVCGSFSLSLSLSTGSLRTNNSGNYDAASETHASASQNCPRQRRQLDNPGWRMQFWESSFTARGSSRISVRNLSLSSFLFVLSSCSFLLAIEHCFWKAQGWIVDGRGAVMCGEWVNRRLEWGEQRATDGIGR